MWTGVLCALLAGAMWGMVFIVPALLAAIALLVVGVMWSVRVHAAEERITPP